MVIICVISVRVIIKSYVRLCCNGIVLGDVKINFFVRFNKVRFLDI